MKCVTLGHGFKSSPVIEHEYLGTDMIIKELKAHSSWKNEVVEVGEFVRDPISKRITKMIIK